jgi:cytochrome c-type biogenesis protein CcmH/NrfG
MSENNTVAKSTMYIAMAVSLLVGFLSGVVYSVYNAPPDTHVAVPSQEDNSKIATLEKEVKEHPDNGIAWTDLGHAYFDSDQYAKAITAYNNSLELHPGNADLLTDLGVMYRRNGQPDKAVESFDRAVKANPRHEQSRFNKGVVLLNDFNDVPGAIKVWEEIIAMNPAATGPTGAPLADLIKDVKKQAAEAQQ